MTVLAGWDYQERAIAALRHSYATRDWAPLLVMSTAGAPKRHAHQVPGWLCPSCDCLNPMGAAFCISCGTPRSTRSREFTVNQHDELVKPQQRPQREIARVSCRAFIARTRPQREFEICRGAHSYKKGWIWHGEQGQAEMFGDVR